MVARERGPYGSVAFRPTVPVRHLENEDVGRIGHHTVLPDPEVLSVQLHATWVQQLLPVLVKAGLDALIPGLARPAILQLSLLVVGVVGVRPAQEQHLLEPYLPVALR